MKKIFLSILIPTLMLFYCGGMTAQTDNRNRKPETVVTDGLTELPAKNSRTYNRIMKELAGTGETGIRLLTSMLRPASEADNSKPEYAINGVVNYVSAEGQEALRKPIHDALITALASNKDNANRAFLLQQISKLATADDFNLYNGLLGDSYLKGIAIDGLAHIKGIDDQVSGIINNAAAPDADLAYLAYFRKLKNVEPQLLKWAASPDRKVKEAALNALAECGSEKSLSTLASGDMDAYLQLLNNLGASKTVISESKKLIKSKNEHWRCAGLYLLLKSDKANAAKNVLAALKDNSGEYRHTALINAERAAGPAIVNEIAAKYKTLPLASQIDVIRWFGNIHAENQIPLICSAINSNDDTLAVAAIEAASKIGGETALEALLAQLAGDGVKAKAAAKALLTFNGNINNGVMKCLDSANSNTVCAALSLASSRHIANAYTKVEALTKSSDAAVSKAAYAALDGVAGVQNFAELCTMLKGSNGETTTLLQNAAKSAIASLPADKQFDMIDAQMKGASNEAIFYPLLAQSGTTNAINKLIQGYNGANKTAALNALLEVNNPEVMGELYNIAAKSNAADKDKILRRYVALVRKAKPTPAQAYFLYSRALDLKPSLDIKKLIIRAFSSSTTLPAAMLMANNLNDPDINYNAASVLGDIVNSNPDLRKGTALKSALEKAIPVFQAQKDKGNADAGYAIDKVNGFFPTWDNNGGFTAFGSEGGKEAFCGEKIALIGDQENFEIYFDFKPEGDVKVLLRGMPLLTWNNDAVTYAVDNKTIPLVSGWNTMHIKMQDDRVTIEVNGTPLASNEMLNIIPGTDKKAPVSGEVSFNGKFAFRNFYFEVLPTTPIFTLSDEEKAQGFEVLFDGRSLENFHGNTTGYVPKDGNIYVTAKYGGSGNLYTKKNYSDFIFRFDFYFDVPAVNNGIGIRTGKDVTGVDAAYDGMEIQVLDHDDPVYQGYPYGYTGLRPYQNHGSVYGIAIPEHIDFGPIKQWHTEEIKAIGDRITVTVDGKVVTDVNIRDAVQGHNVAPDGSKTNPYTLDHKNHPGLFKKEGYISFCGHGPGVMFRNVRVLDLSKKEAGTKTKNKKKAKK